MEYENATGRVYDIQGYAVHDGPGIRTTVYTKGCPLHCLWCHSPESQHFEFELGYLPLKCLGTELCQDACVKACAQGAISSGAPENKIGSTELIRKAVIDRGKCRHCFRCADACISKAIYTAGWDTTVDEVYERLMKDRGFFDNGGGVTVSGGEAMMQFDFTYNLVKRLKDSGIHICLDTTGYAETALFEKILPYVDLFLYDLKQMDSKKHQSFTGVPNEPILENARFLAAHGGALQVRVPVIPKFSDSMENLRRTAEFCASLGEGVKLVQLLPYHKMGKMKYDRLGLRYRLSNVEPPAEAFMLEALALFQSLGLNSQLY